MTHRSRLSTVIAALLLAAPLTAQDARQEATAQSATPVAAVATTTAPTADVTPSLAPTTSNSAVGVRRATAEAPALPMAPVDRSPAMMIVGGVALIAGAVIGGTPGTIIMIGGAVIGLFGLWNYLQ